MFKSGSIIRAYRYPAVRRAAERQNSAYSSDWWIPDVPPDFNHGKDLWVGEIIRSCYTTKVHIQWIFPVRIKWLYPLNVALMLHEEETANG